MVFADYEVDMSPVDVSRDGDLLTFEFQGEFWPLPIELARRLASDRRLIDAVRSLTLVGIVRKPKKESE